MTWLILSWAITLSFYPSTLPNSSIPSNLEADCPGFYSSSLDLYFNAFDHLRVYTDWTAYALSAGNGFFYPYRIDYTFGIGLHTRSLELGIRHECDHPTLFFEGQPFRKVDLSSETMLYLRLSGRTN